MTTDGQPLHVPARPDPFDFDPATTAVVVVDMQHDFAAPDGMFGRAGIAIDAIRSVVEPTRRVLDAAREAGILVVYLVMQFKADLSDLGGQQAPNRSRHLHLGVGDVIAAPDGTTSRILVQGTWNTQIVEELTPQSNDLVVAKHRYSGFFETELDALLRERGVTSLVFTGCTTSVCVESTLRDAFYRDYRCLLLSDCCAEAIGSDAPRSNHDATLTVIEALFGWTGESTSFLTALMDSAVRAS